VITRHLVINQGEKGNEKTNVSVRKKERKNESCFPASFLCCQVVLFVMMIMMMLLLLYIPARVVIFFFFFFSCAAATLARAAICTRLFLQLLLAYGKRSLQCSSILFLLLCWLLVLVAVAKRTRICFSSSPSSSSSAVRLCSKSRIRCMCSEKQSSSSSSSAVGLSVCLCYKSNTRDCERDVNQIFFPSLLLLRPHKNFFDIWKQSSNDPYYFGAKN
jgi:hypothetical protein